MNTTDKDRERAEELLRETNCSDEEARERIAQKLAGYREEDQQKPESTFVTNDKVGSVSQ